jgi:hypothetical protein
MSYLIIHRSSFLFRSPPWTTDTKARHWNLRKVNHVLPRYLFNQRSCPTSFKCLYQIRCSKFTMFPCILTQEVVWRHHRAVVNRVVPLESDHPIHNNQPNDRPYKLLQRLREFPFESSWLFILPMKVFVISVPCFLVAPIVSNLGMRFLLKVESCNTQCYGILNSLR